MLSLQNFAYDCFQFLLGLTIAPREIENNADQCLCKILKRQRRVNKEYYDSFWRR